MVRLRPAVVPIALLLAACGRKPEVKPDPDRAVAPTTPSVSASASASAVASAAASLAPSSSASGGVGLDTIALCHDGTFGSELFGGSVGDSFGYGGLGMTGTGTGGGKGEGIGLGTVGGFGKGASGAGYGAGAGPNRTTMTGSTKVVAGKVDGANAGRAICGAFSRLRTCFDAVEKAKTTYSGSALVKIVVSAEGKVDSVTPSGGTLTDAGLGTCLATELKTVTFPKPDVGSTTLEYTVDYLRVPAVASAKVKVIETGVTITGRLPPEVVRRIIRANFPRLRACYEAGLNKDRKLVGTVFTHFVIDKTGEVEKVTEGVGTLADKTVRGCVLGVFRTLSFPEPEGGEVIVKYGIDFQNDP